MQQDVISMVIQKWFDGRELLLTFINNKMSITNQSINFLAYYIHRHVISVANKHVIGWTVGVFLHTECNNTLW